MPRPYTLRQTPKNDKARLLIQASSFPPEADLRRT